MTETGWRLDRQVTLGLILAIVLETAGALLWAGRTAERVESLEAELKALAPVAERLARLEEQAVGSRAALERIERKLDGSGA
jgi:type VI protein secretion system component VasK